jgi:DMSO/TMAO reductase YedYZ molybdopterin-dependent catalytic subunit
MCRNRLIMLTALTCSLASFVFAQSSPSISVTGAVRQPLTLTAADLAKMPRASAKAANNSFGIVYEGVWLSDVLKKAGVPLGGELRGAALSSYVIASASDGYQVVVSLGELDPDLTDGQILVADTANGKLLAPEGGAFRLVLPKDKTGVRSVRFLTKLEVVQLK